jgi:PTS system fructose-specific IIA component
MRRKAVSLADAFKEGCIDLNIEGEDKYEVIKTMVSRAADIYSINHKALRDIINDVISREKLMSTGMQYGIAIPHCSTQYIDKMMICIGISKHGVNFDSTDGTLAKIIVLLVVPKSKLNEHVKTMAAIARLLNQKEIREEILKAENEEKIIEVFSKIE